MCNLNGTLLISVRRCMLEMVASLKFPYSVTSIEMGIFGNTFFYQNFMNFVAMEIKINIENNYSHHSNFHVLILV